MTKAMPFLQKAILLSYDPRRLGAGDFYVPARNEKMLRIGGNWVYTFDGIRCIIMVDFEARFGYHLFEWGAKERESARLSLRE